MSHREGKNALIDERCTSAVAALENDQFYRSICGAYAYDAAGRRVVLERYFAYSIKEGEELGRCFHVAEPASGVAVWLLPQSPDVQSLAARNKRAFLEKTLDAEGCANYYRIVEFMKMRAASLVADDAWYLSIVAVHPAAQRQGLGRQLLEPTIAEADRCAATCHLETFNHRSVAFYERLGFVVVARFEEPTVGAAYAMMVRHPATQTVNSAPPLGQDR
jgi:ribosomal protein S18 acetylase RimI-like enzyme